MLREKASDEETFEGNEGASHVDSGDSVPGPPQKPVQMSYWECGCLHSRKNKEARVVGMERVSGKSVR